MGCADTFLLVEFQGSWQVNIDLRDNTDTHSQSICLLCVKQKMNSSTTRSMPTVRLMSSRAVSSGLLNMK